MRREINLKTGEETTHPDVVVVLSDASIKARKIAEITETAQALRDAQTEGLAKDKYPRAPMLLLARVSELLEKKFDGTLTPEDATELGKLRGVGVYSRRTHGIEMGAVGAVNNFKTTGAALQDDCDNLVINWPQLP